MKKREYIYFQNMNNISYIKNSVDRLNYEIDKIKFENKIDNNDVKIANHYIDKSINEVMKIKNNISELYENNENNQKEFKTIDKRINDAFKRINKLENQSRNKSNNNSNKNSNNLNNRHVCEDPTCENSEDIKDNKDNKVIRIQSNMPSGLQIFPLLNLLDKIGGEQERKEPPNELIDSEDEFDNELNVYENPYESSSESESESESDIIEISDPIDSIDDLIKIGKKYKSDENKEKKEKDKKEKKIKRPDTGNRITPDIFKKVFNFDGKRKINGPFGEIKITKIGGEEFSSESELEEEKDKSDTSVKKYYTYNKKKYSMDIQKVINLMEPLQKLKNTIGMNKVKQQLFDMILYYIQGFESTTSDMLHSSIEGPPGVGKTKLGRILAHIYSSLGIIPSKRFKRVRRTDLIGKYVGHTAHKTQEVIDEAEGGVLFIDEAYSLGDNDGKDTFSKECIDTINQNLTEKKKNLIVIVAGYTDQLEKSFFSVNEGLRRRFPFRFQIDGYDEKELTEIFYTKIRKLNWRLDMKLNREYLENFFKLNKDKFKNYGGDIETIIMNCKMSHARRVVGKSYKNKKILNIDDLENAYKKYIDNKKKEDNNEHTKSMYL
jgi:hypothetical protein